MDIPHRGNIRDVSLVRILVSINRNRKTGTLSLKTPAFEKKIYLEGGDAVFASSSYEDDRLGEMLLKANKITVEQYDKSVEILKSSKKRQGAILVELGYISPKDLFWGVKYQVREIIYSMFQLEEAEYEFEEGYIPTQEVITLKMSMGNLIYEGVKRIENWTRIRQEMPDTASVLRLSDDPLSLFQEIELTSQDRKILSLIDGRRSIAEIIEGSWMGSFEALRILYVLFSTGIVEQVPGGGAESEAEPVTVQEILNPLPEEEDAFLKKVEGLYSRLGSMSLHELLELKGDKAAPDEIRKNYYRLAREFHPDRNFAIADESIKDKLTAIFDALSEAYNRLAPDAKQGTSVERAAGGSTAEPARAREQFKKGVAEFKKGNFEKAADNFGWAAKIMPASPGYWNYLSLAYSKIPGRLKDAEDAILEAVRLEPHNADYHANLGLIYLKAGVRKKAKGSFARALELDPGNEKARKGFAQTKD